LGFAYLYLEKGLRENYFLNALWIYCVFLIIKDFVYFARYGFRCDVKKGCDTKKD
jgi:hypothetical protein